MSKHLYVLWNIKERRVEGIHESKDAAEDALRAEAAHPAAPSAEDFEVLTVTK